MQVLCFIIMPIRFSFVGLNNDDDDDDDDDDVDVDDDELVVLKTVILYTTILQASWCFMEISIIALVE